MPLYEYKCECGKQFEELGSASLITAPCECGKLAKRIISKCSFKVWKYDPSVMDAEAECRRCGVDT